jgi:hypothetical protein
MNPKLFAFCAVGVRHSARSYRITDIVGYVFELDQERAREYAERRWRGVQPRLKPRSINLIEIPTTELPPTRDYTALVPAHSIPGIQVRALIGWPLAKGAA